MFNIKFNSYYRSQLVVKEFSQVKGINFNELFSLVIHYEIACLFLAVTALKNWDIHSVDIKTTYLYGDLNKKIYMKQFKDFRLSNKEKKVWKLHKALYGLKQASLSWWQTITKLISVLEFK